MLYHQQASYSGRQSGRGLTACLDSVYTVDMDVFFRRMELAEWLYYTLRQHTFAMKHTNKLVTILFSSTLNSRNEMEVVRAFAVSN